MQIHGENFTHAEIFFMLFKNAEADLIYCNNQKIIILFFQNKETMKILKLYYRKKLTGL